MAKQEKWAIANERTTTGFTASYVCVSKKTYSHVSRARISPIHSPCSFTSVMVFYFHLFIESLYSLFCGIFRLIFICLWVRHMWSALLKYYISVCHSHRKCESMICFDILYHRRNIRPTSLASYGIWWRQQLQQQRKMMWIVIIKIIVSARDTQKCACVVCVVTVMSKTIRHFFSAEIVVFFSRCFLASSLLCRINCHYMRALFVECWVREGAIIFYGQCARSTFVRRNDEKCSSELLFAVFDVMWFFCPSPVIYLSFSLYRRRRSIRVCTISFSQCFFSQMFFFNAFSLSVLPNTQPECRTAMQS